MIPDYHYPPDPPDGPNTCKGCDDLLEACKCEDECRGSLCTDTICFCHDAPVPSTPREWSEPGLEVITTEDLAALGLTLTEVETDSKGKPSDRASWTP